MNIEMRKILAVLLFAPFFIACEKEIEEPAGKWTPMEWENISYTKVTDTTNGEYYIVPVEGGDFVFRCKNYGPWLSSLRLLKFDKSMNLTDNQDIYGDDIKNHVSYTNDWCSVLTKGDSLKVTFQKNDTLPRGLSVTVTAGDVFGYFKFIQESQTK